ncbi:MAG TPA: methyltransferase domain-containing protein [Rhodobacteraceae bacterium]|nr:methyltransferase domain-containing protein [Paracoccaceae bacterium]
MYQSGTHPDLGERIESAYQCREVAAHRKHVLDILSPDVGETVLDIGCGPGFLTSDVAQSVGAFGQVTGVDISEQMIDFANANNAATGLDFRVGDALSLPFNRESFDVAVSTQVVEYVEDADQFCAEVARVLRPGGRAVISVTDWRGVNWHAKNEKRMKAVMNAFSLHCAQQDLPKTLAPRLRKAGLEVDRVVCFPIVSLGERDGSYCQVLAAFVLQFILSAGLVRPELMEAWLDDLRQLKKARECFFSVDRFDFLVRKGSSTDGWSPKGRILH